MGKNKRTASGDQKLVIQASAKTDEGALWTHQGDDDLPDPQVLKQGTYAWRHKDYHQGKQVTAWLAAGDLRRLRRLQKKQQLSFAAWLRHVIALDEAQRPSEAGEYVRQIIPEQVAVLAERELTLSAETLMAVADRQEDWQAKRQLRAEAGTIMDAAAYFTRIRQLYERLHSP